MVGKDELKKVLVKTYVIRCTTAGDLSSSMMNCWTWARTDHPKSIKQTLPSPSKRRFCDRGDGEARVAGVIGVKVVTAAIEMKVVGRT